jgi:hypothetical protein
MSSLSISFETEAGELAPQHSHFPRGSQEIGFGALVVARSLDSSLARSTMRSQHQQSAIADHRSETSLCIQPYCNNCGLRAHSILKWILNATVLMLLMRKDVPDW